MTMGNERASGWARQNADRLTQLGFDFDDLLAKAIAEVNAEAVENVRRGGDAGLR